MIHCKREGNNRHAVMVANVQNAFDSVAGCGCMAGRCAGFITRLRPNDELPPRPKLLASNNLYTLCIYACHVYKHERAWL
jgi:hypothetical protein